MFKHVLQLKYREKKIVMINYFGQVNERQKMHGIGRYTQDNNGIYEGSFENGKHHGFGRLISGNGDYYEGYFKNGVYSGFGEWQSYDAKQFKKGQWLFGHLLNENHGTPEQEEKRLKILEKC